MLSITNKHIMLSVVMLSVVMLSVVAPLEMLARDKHLAYLTLHQLRRKKCYDIVPWTIFFLSAWCNFVLLLRHSWKYNSGTCTIKHFAVYKSSQ
jgi:hypothetical protein